MSFEKDHTSYTNRTGNMLKFGLKIWFFFFNVCSMYNQRSGTDYYHFPKSIRKARLNPAKRGNWLFRGGHIRSIFNLSFLISNWFASDFIISRKLSWSNQEFIALKKIYVLRENSSRIVLFRLVYGQRKPLSKRIHLQAN